MSRLPSIFALLSVGAGDGASPAAIREEMKALWDSLESFSFRCEMAMVDGRGEIIPGKTTWRHEFARGSGGRWALKTTATSASGVPRAIRDDRENGRRRYSIGHLGDDPGWISRIGIQPQASTADSYDGTMFGLAWLLMPGGRPIHARIDAEATISEGAEDGRRVVTIAAEHNGQPLRIALLPDRDWLAKGVELGDRSGPAWSAWEATRFERVNGRWFPVEGLEERQGEYGRQRWKFAAADLVVNEPIPPGRFAMPRATDGVMVIDDVAKETSIAGGEEAQERLNRRYRALHPSAPKAPEAPPPGDIIVAGRDPERFPWAIAIIIFSLAILASGIALRLRDLRARP